MPAGPPRHAAARPARRASLLAGLLAAAALAVACSGGDATSSPPDGGPGGSPTAAPDPLEVYRAIAEAMVEIRQLEAPSRADPEILDADQLRTNLQAEFDKSYPADRLAPRERIEKALGLLPADASLRSVMLELQNSQVIGYYDPSVDELFIVSRSGGLGPTQRATYAHEFVHELQDRHFDLESLGLEGAIGESDRRLARLALVEGDATSAQTAWITANLSPVELGQMVAEAADPLVLEVMGRTPAILLETSLFSYQAGAVFVEGLLGRGGYAAVDDAYGALPDSTEQIIHPEKYLAGESPVDVALPADLAARFGTGWTLDAQDTFGELQLRVWLREGRVAGDVARIAADGWGGDRLALLAAPGGAGDVVVLVTDWDSATDARDFRTAATAALEGYGRPGSVVAGSRRVVVAIGEGMAQVGDLEAILEALAAS